MLFCFTLRAMLIDDFRCLSWHGDARQLAAAISLLRDTYATLYAAFFAMSAAYIMP